MQSDRTKVPKKKNWQDWKEKQNVYKKKMLVGGWDMTKNKYIYIPFSNLLNICLYIYIYICIYIVVIVK